MAKAPFPTGKICQKKCKSFWKIHANIWNCSLAHIHFLFFLALLLLLSFRGVAMLEKLASSQATRQFHRCRHFSLILTSRGFYLHTGSPEPRVRQATRQLLDEGLHHLFSLQMQRYSQDLLNKLWWVNPAVVPSKVVCWVEGVSFAFPWLIPWVDNSWFLIDQYCSLVQVSSDDMWVMCLNSYW